MNPILYRPGPLFFQLLKKVLFLSALMLGVFHLLLTLFQYYIDFWLFAPYERWFALVLLIAALLSLAAGLLSSRSSKNSVKTLLAGCMSYEQAFIFAMFLWYAVICLVLQTLEDIPYLKMEDWWILDTGISALILFPLGRFVAKEKSSFLMNGILQLLVISYSVFTAWALWRVFCLDFPVMPSGETIELSRDFKLYFCIHYNTTGAIACVMMALSLHLFFSQKAVLLKVFYAIAFLLHLVVLMLSNSRTAFLAALFLVFCAAFFYFWHCIKENSRRPAAVNLLLCILPAAVCGFVFWQLRSVVINGFDALSGFSKAMNLSSARKGVYYPAVLSSVKSLSPAPLAAREITPDLNGRGDIWRAALKVIFSSPKSFFFGVTPVGITHALTTIGGLTEEFYGTHNAFLDVATEFGVPALLAFLVFTVKIIIRCFRILFRIKSREFFRIFMIPLTIFTLYVLNLTEGYLIGSFCVQSSLFFLLCGWVVFLDKSVGHF